MKRKIIMYYLVLFIISTSITGFFTSNLAQRYYNHEVEEKLKSITTIIKYEIDTRIQKNQPIDLNEFSSEYAKLLGGSDLSNIPYDLRHIRITFIDYEGKVLGESDTNYLSMENHLGRKEIKEAIAGKTGRDIRSSKTLSTNFLYIAMPLDSSKIVVRVSIPLIQLQFIDHSILFYMIFSVIAGFLITTLLAFKFSSTITRPVNQLISVSNDIARGDFSKRADIHSYREIEYLAETFNLMTSELEKSMSNLIQENIRIDTIINSIRNGVVAVDSGGTIILINDIACNMFGFDSRSSVINCGVIDVVKNQQINEMIHHAIKNNTSISNEIGMGAAGEKSYKVSANPIKSHHDDHSNSGAILLIADITNVKKLEQIRTEFVSNVTHELKTPLTSIRGFIETLKNGALDDKNVAHHFLDIIDIEAERLYILINDILQLSEIETRQKDNNISVYNLKEIIDETLCILDGMAEKRGIQLINHSNDNICITANRDRIKQMLINLIDNAIKYNHDNGKVEIFTSKSDGRITINIKDTGIGIPPEHTDRIFERFYRVDKGRSRTMGGTGLGLSIVKHIVSLYNGDIKLDSTVGKGTEFTIHLPV